MYSINKNIPKTPKPKVIMSCSPITKEIARLKKENENMRNKLLEIYQEKEYLVSFNFSTSRESGTGDYTVNIKGKITSKTINEIRETIRLEFYKRKGEVKIIILNIINLNML